jgi:gliding motility-associated-like protein
MYSKKTAKNVLYIFLRYGTFLLLTLPLIAFSQGENNNWLFYSRLGMDFTNGTPVFYGDTYLPESLCASVSDPVGNLLFSSSVDTVYDRYFNPMPNGTGIGGYGGVNIELDAEEINSNVCIVPNPGNNQQYYIICIGPLINDSNSRNAYYSLVDMSLNNGLGDIVPGSKAILFATGIRDGIVVASRLPNCTGYWVVLHKDVDNKFLSFGITATGLNTSPVISNGLLSTSPIDNNFDDGEMCYNNATGRLVNCWNCYYPPYGIAGRIETAILDKSTGIFSNFQYLFTDSVIVTNYDLPYFATYFHHPVMSPDGSKLYVARESYRNTYDSYIDIDVYYSNEFSQFDLSLLPNVTAVQNSRYIVDSTNFHYYSRVGPDGKIYHARGTDSASIAVINSPNAGGLACNYVAPGLTLPATTLATFQGLNFRLYGFGYPVLFNVPQDTLFGSISIDTMVCPIDTLMLTANTDYSAILWSTGGLNNIEKIGSSGTYWVKGIKDCFIHIDTFKVRFTLDTLVGQTKDTTLCFGQPLTTTAPLDYQSPLWSTGSTSHQVTLTEPGSYWVSGIKNCTLHIDSFEVHYPNYTLDLGKDTIICEGQFLTLDVSTTEASYLWQDGTTNATYTVNDEGIYSVAVTKDGCMFSDTISVSIIYPKLDIQEHDTTICAGERITLHATASPQSTFYWNTGTGGLSTETNGAGVYTVAATNICGTFHDSVRVKEKDCPCVVFVPNAFSPNSDGRNDMFDVSMRCPFLTSYLLTVYNRYGQKIFESLRPEKGWNGWYNGNPVDPGTYFYYLKYKDGQKETRKKGDLILIR